MSYKLKVFIRFHACNPARAFVSRFHRIPVLLFPIIVPIILAAVNATREVLIHQEMETFIRWIQILVSFDVIFLAAGFVVFDYVVGD